MTFNEVFAKYKSLKLTLHSYGPIFDRFLESKREQFKDILEIGVLEGESMKGWREYFPNANIVGLDADLSHCQTFDDPTRISTYRVECPKDLATWAGDRTFDTVIDDGCHFPYVQVAVWATLWPRVRPGGVYIIEDVMDISYAKEMELQFRGQVFDLRNVINRHDDIMVVWEKP